MLFDEKRFILFAAINTTILILIVWLFDIGGIKTMGNTGWLLLACFFVIGLLSFYLAEKLFSLERLDYIAASNIAAALVAIVLINFTYSISIISVPTLLFLTFITPSVTFLVRKTLIRG